jgi:hypothetical protein
VKGGILYGDISATTMNKSASVSYKWVVLIILLAGFIRFYDLGRDPPPAMGLHFISDEGWWIHNARNRVLYGQWVQDEFNQSLLVSPLFCLSTMVVYRIADIGFASSRIVPAFSGWLSLIFFFLVIRARRVPMDRSILAVLFLSLGFAFCSLNRIAYVDSTAFLFIMIAWWLLEVFPHKSVGLLGAGIVAAMAIMTKSYVLTLVPVFATIYISRLWHRKISISQEIRKLLLLSSGLLASGVFWYLLLYQPFQDQYRIMYHLWQDGNIPSSLKQIVRNIPTLIVRHTQDGIGPVRFLNLNMVLFFFGWWRLLQIFSVRSKTIRQAVNSMHPIDWEAILWMIWVVAIVSPLTAKPFRRYIFWYPPLIMLGSGVTESADVPAPGYRETSASLPLRCLRFCIFLLFPVCLAAPWLSIRLSGLAGNFRDILPDWFQVSADFFFMFIIMFTLACIIVMYTRFSWGRKMFPALSVQATLALFLIVEIVQFTPATLLPTYTLRDTSLRLGSEYFSSETTVLGGIADTLVMENTARPISIWGREEAQRVLNQNPLERYHPQFIVILKSLDGISWGIEERYYKYVKPQNLLETIYLLPTGREKFRVTAELYRSPR